MRKVLMVTAVLLAVVGGALGLRLHSQRRVAAMEKEITAMQAETCRTAKEDHQRTVELSRKMPDDPRTRAMVRSSENLVRVSCEH